MTEKRLRDCQASVRILEANIQLFHDGVRETYRVVATELRKLLCDGRKSRNSLLPRLVPNPQLRKLAFTEKLEQNPEMVALGFQSLTPGPLLVTRQRTRLTLEFANSGALMPLDKWLDQPILGPLSIRELIRSVANKEGAHADPSDDATLAYSRRVRFSADESQMQVVVALGE